MNKLLLKGNGQEAIKILESLGKRNTYKLLGNEVCCGYTYNSNDEIVFERFIMDSEEYTELTVDAYKSLVNLVPVDASPKEECPIIKVPKIKFNSIETELDLGNNYEVINKCGKWYVTRKIIYPTNYDHCCDVLGIDVSRDIEHSEHLPFYRDINQYDVDLLGYLRQFRKLLICLHAYWKVYGEENGLNKPWEPIHKEGLDITFYTIYRFNGEIKKGATAHRHSILEFPTEELRDMFYSNFETLIENCKVLL